MAGFCCFNGYGLHCCTKRSEGGYETGVSLVHADRQKATGIPISPFSFMATSQILICSRNLYESDSNLICKDQLSVSTLPWKHQICATLKQKKSNSSHFSLVMRTKPKRGTNIIISNVQSAPLHCW